MPPRRILYLWNFHPFSRAQPRWEQVDNRQVKHLPFSEITQRLINKLQISTKCLTIVYNFRSTRQQMSWNIASLTLRANSDWKSGGKSQSQTAVAHQWWIESRTHRQRVIWRDKDQCFQVLPIHNRIIVENQECGMWQLYPHLWLFSQCLGTHQGKVPWVHHS